MSDPTIWLIENLLSNDTAVGTRPNSDGNSLVSAAITRHCNLVLRRGSRGKSLKILNFDVLTDPKCLFGLVRTYVGPKN